MQTFKLLKLLYSIPYSNKDLEISQQFLKESKCYNEFFEEIFRDKCHLLINTISTNDTIINEGIHWSKSIYGVDYWLSKNDSLIRKLRKPKN